MKKIFLCLLLIASVFSLSFAKDNDDYDDTQLALVPGLKFSLLGLEPTFAVNYSNFEAEVACAITTGVSGEGFGVAPSLSVAYCSNPFDKGAVATFGLEYLMVTSSYIKAFDLAEADDIIFHSFSLFYKGGYRFNDVFGLNWRFRLPVFMGGSSGGESVFYNITNTKGGLVCVLAGVITISVGVQFTIR